MTKVVKLRTKTDLQGTAWFNMGDFQVGRRLRFRSCKLGIEEVYRITQVLDKDWVPRRGRQALTTRDKVRLMSPTGETKTPWAIYLRLSVQWELLDD